MSPPFLGQPGYQKGGTPLSRIPSLSKGGAAGETHRSRDRMPPTPEELPYDPHGQRNQDQRTQDQRSQDQRRGLYPPPPSPPKPHPRSFAMGAPDPRASLQRPAGRPLERPQEYQPVSPGELARQQQAQQRYWLQQQQNMQQQDYSRQLQLQQQQQVLQAQQAWEAQQARAQRQAAPPEGDFSATGPGRGRTMTRVPTFERPGEPPSSLPHSSLRIRVRCGFRDTETESQSLGLILKTMLHVLSDSLAFSLASNWDLHNFIFL